MCIVDRVMTGIGLIIGFAGAIILWKSSFGYESIPAWGSRENPDNGASRRNKRRQKWQQIGFLCIALGFILQFVGIL
jgi:hypothetical protein